MAERKPDVLVVGAGPVGLAAALELTRRGFAPRMIDQDDGPTGESRALGVNARTLELLEPSGLAERMIAAGLRLERLIAKSGTTEVAKIELNEIPHRFNFMLCLPQSEIERLFIEALSERGIEMQWRTRLKTLRANGDGLACHVRNAKEEVVLHPGMVIGADGAHSTVRKGLGIGFDGESDPDHWGLADIELEDWPFPWDTVVLSLGNQQVCGFIPIREGLGRFVANRPDVLDRLPPEAKVKSVVWQSEFHISYRQVETYQRGSAFLAGDAAHIHSPVGARGMNLGIEDACWLSWLIAEGRTGQYTELRRPVGRKVLDFTHRQTRAVAARSAWTEVVARYFGPAFLKLGFVRRGLLKRVAGLDSPPAPWLAG